MLGKLIKNEFKSTAHSMFGIYLSALITFAVMLVVFLIKNKTLMVISSVALVGISIAAIVITLFTIIGSFNKSLYGAQGYLSFTLPVSGKNLLASKMSVSLIWVLLSFVFTILVSVFLVFYWVAQTSDNLKNVLNTIYNMLQTMQGVPDADTAIKSMIVVVIFLFIKAILLIFKVSFSLTLANTKTFQKFNPILAAILIFFAVYIFVTTANAAAVYIPVSLAIASNGIGLMVNETLYGLASDADVFLSVPFLGYIFEMLVCAALYYVTGNIMTKHVNIK